MSTGSIEILAGNTFETPKHIELSLLGDPVRFSELTSRDSRVMIQSESEGIYQIKINLPPQRILSNTPVATLTYSGNSRQISIVNTTFTTQDGVQYNLSNTFEE